MRKYTSIFASSRHIPIHTMKQLKSLRTFEASLTLFCNNKMIGTGGLIVKGPTTVHTDYVSLDKGFRRKGHGIRLYFALIDTARKLGASRIYSSQNLNKYSRRMWAEKLKEYFEVKEFRNRKRCRRCGCRCNRKQPTQYYIQLKGKI